TLPPAPAHANVAPAPHSPAMQACWVEYSVNHMPANYGLAGTSDAFTWWITYSGVLVRHPKGDVVIDVGNSSHFDREIESAGFFTRLLLRAYPGAGDVVATASNALRRAHEDPAQLSWIVLSHVHADHAGGIIDVPKVPVVLSQQELDFVRAERDRGHFD